MGTRGSIAFNALGIIGVLSQPGCADSDQRFASSSWAIENGTDVRRCTWSAVVDLDQTCTGVFIAPRVLITAAHCMGDFEVAMSDNGPIELSNCQVYPDYGFGSGTDVAYCVAESTVRSYLPIAEGCETDEVRPGVPVTIVGFGRSIHGPAGSKREARAVVLDVGDELLIGETGGAAPCPGDSGGPAIIEGPHGPRVLAISSSRRGEGCNKDPAYYVRMAPWVDWIEASSGIDISPCFERGTWAPGPRCRGFDTSGRGTEGMNGRCQPTDVSGPGQSCGPPFEPPPENVSCAFHMPRRRPTQALAGFLCGLVLWMRRRSSA